MARSIHQAVLQNDLKLVRFLLHRDKSLLDLQDAYGATPLMLAAMMRSAKLVTFLLRKGASWDIMDRDGYTAVKYAKHADKINGRYRKVIKRGTTKDTARRHKVYTYLKNEPLLHTQYRTKPAGTLSFQRNGRSLRIFKLIKKVKIGGKVTRNTTSACIAPGNTTKPQMCAVSGWAASNSPGVLDGCKYTQIVRDMAKLLGFKLSKDNFDSPCHDPDPGPHNKGRAHASHCEKLLGAYWVTEQLQYAFGSPDLARIRDLKSVELPEQRKQAVIYLDHSPCIPCLLFLGEIQKATGIKICAVPQASVREVSRNEKLIGVCENCTCPKCTSARTKQAKKQQPAVTTDTAIPDHVSDDTNPSDPSDSDDTVVADSEPIVADSEPIVPANLAQPPRQRAPTRPRTPSPPREQTKPETWLDFGVDPYGNRVWKPPHHPIFEEPFPSDARANHRKPPTTPVLSSGSSRHLISSPALERGRRLGVEDISGRQRDVPISSIEPSDSEAPDPRSYQAGSSAYFGEVAVCLGSQKKNREEYQLVPPSPSSPSTSSSSASSPQSRPRSRPQPSLNLLQKSQKARIAKRMENVQAQLQLQRFTYHDAGQRPNPRPTTATNRVGKKPPRKPQKNKIGAKAAEKRGRGRPRKDTSVLAGRSTLAANARFRQQAAMTRKPNPGSPSGSSPRLPPRDTQ